MKVSVVTPSIFAKLAGRMLKSLDILDVVLLCICVLTAFLSFLPFTDQGITSNVIFLHLPILLVLKFKIFSILPSICSQAFIIKYRSLLLSKL